MSFAQRSRASEGYNRVVTKGTDLLLIAWAVVVMVTYYAGSANIFNPQAEFAGSIVPWVGSHTDVLSALYGLMLIVSVAYAAFSYLRRPRGKPDSSK